MDHYIDIHLRPDPEFVAQVLLNALYAKLHKALVQLKTTSIGVSFPKHTAKQLGAVLRLHGTQSALAQLQALTWLGAMTEFVQADAVASVPVNTQHRKVQRVQVQSSPERVKRRLVKRMMQREGLNEAQATERIHVPTPQNLTEPFIALHSHSSGQRFRLFIRHAPLQDQAQEGPFSAYGLSSSSTVPWF